MRTISHSVQPGPSRKPSTKTRYYSTVLLLSTDLKALGGPVTRGEIRSTIRALWSDKPTELYLMELYVYYYHMAAMR